MPPPANAAEAAPEVVALAEGEDGVSREKKNENSGAGRTLASSTLSNHGFDWYAIPSGIPDGPASVEEVF